MVILDSHRKSFVCNSRLKVDLFVVFQLQYGEPVIRRAVPLALAILSASNPQLSIIDTLSKLSHDNDAEVSHNSIFAMGIVGAGQLTLVREHVVAKNRVLIKILNVTYLLHVHVLTDLRSLL